jgi:hypothetical protein
MPNFQLQASYISKMLDTLSVDRIYRADGSVGILEDHSLDAYQEAVGGYIEPFLRGSGKIVYINEDGLSLGLKPNPYLPIVGDFVVLREEDA